MKILFFDCSSGISGNMVLGALAELVGEPGFLEAELEKLGVGGYELRTSRVQKNGIGASYVDVILKGANGHGGHAADGQQEDHDGRDVDGQHDNCDGLSPEGEQEDHVRYAVCGKHEDHVDHDLDRNHEHGEQRDHADDRAHHEHGNHAHAHEHRNLEDVIRIIEGSVLEEPVKELAKRIFLRVAKAESRVHGIALNHVHFHEVGAIDSIVDIVGTAILVNRIKPDRIVASVVNDGRGFINCAHGRMAVPVPAVCEIFAERQARTRQLDIGTELVTPTGAAIIAELAETFGTMPELVVAKVGWGAGTKELEIPNVLKVVMGEDGIGRSGQAAAGSGAMQSLCDDVIVLETNLDDCTGEILGYTSECLMEAGALDVWYTPIYMKKSRPAYMLSVLCRDKMEPKLEEIIFRETTTTGIRVRSEYRRILKREPAVLETPFGEIRGKKVFYGSRTCVYPEYEGAREVAEREDIPLREVYRWKYGKS